MSAKSAVRGVTPLSLTFDGFRGLGEGLLTLFFLIVLVAAWIAVFFPSLRRAKESSPYPSTKAFKRSMSRVSPTGGGLTGLVMTPTSLRAHANQLAFERRQRRRRITFATLLIMAGITGLTAVTAGGGWVELHLAIDGVLFGYVAWLIENRNRRAERFLKVRRLPPVARPAYLDDVKVQTGT